MLTAARLAHMNLMRRRSTAGQRIVSEQSKRVAAFRRAYLRLSEEEREWVRLGLSMRVRYGPRVPLQSALPAYCAWLREAIL